MTKSLANQTSSLFHLQRSEHINRSGKLLSHDQNIESGDHIKEGRDSVGGSFEEPSSIIAYKSKETTDNFTEKSSVYKPSISIASQPDRPNLDEKKVKKLVRKIDAHMFPCICLLYMLNHLDRSNIANARIGGMEADLKLSSTDYSAVILVFFIGYLAAEIPSNMLLPRIRPSLFLPALAGTCGLLVALISLVKKKESLIVARLFMGFIESGFFPGVVFILPSWYQKAVLVKRIGILYSCGILAGALRVGGIRGWRCLFIIEGCVTILSAIIVRFFFPDWPSNTKWLSEEEKALTMLRLQAKKMEVVKTKPTLRESLMTALKDWRTYLFSFMYLMILSSHTISYFIPTIVNVSMGYKGQQAQFMSAPPYLVACAFSIAVPISVDHFGQEVFHVAILIAISGLLYSLCLGVTAPQVRYALVCLAFGGSYDSVPVVLAWVINVAGANKEKKAITVAIVNTIGNLASFYGSFLWPISHAPRFVMGFSMIASFAFSCAIIATLTKLLLVRFPQSTPRKPSDITHRYPEGESRVRKDNKRC